MPDELNTLISTQNPFISYSVINTTDNLLLFCSIDNADYDSHEILSGYGFYGIGKMLWQYDQANINGCITQSESYNIVMALTDRYVRFEQKVFSHRTDSRQLRPTVQQSTITIKCEQN